MRAPASSHPALHEFFRRCVPLPGGFGAAVSWMAGRASPYSNRAAAAACLLPGKGLRGERWLSGTLQDRARERTGFRRPEQEPG